jgi:HAD superfamily hydrolase (TIGR01509 family)
LLWVETIPIERAHWQEMRAALARRKLAVDVHARYRIGQVDLRGSFADYDGNLSKNHRRSLRKDLHRLEREGPTEFHLHSEFTAEEVPAALDRVFQLETATWKAAADGCVARVAGLPQFYIRQCQQLAQWGCLRLASLGHRGSLVAFELGWTAKGIFHSIRVGYRQDYRPYGPGHLLRRWLIEKLFQEGDVQTIDFQGPMTDALAQWSTSSYQVGRLVAVPSRLSSRAIWIAYRALAPVLRRLRRQSCDPAPIQNPESFMTAPRAVVFDMDGLMFNTEDVYWQVGTELLRRRGRCFSRELSDAMMGRPPQTCFDVMIRWHSLKETWQELAAESEEIFLGLLDQYLAPMPGLMELLAALEKAGIGKAIGTSSSRRSLEAILSRFALQPRFQFTLTAEDITHGKPDPEIYLQAASRFGVAPRDMLVLEDSQTGCRSASAAGAIVVAVPGAHSMSQDFSAAGLVLRSLADRRLYALLELPAV